MFRRRSILPALLAAALAPALLPQSAVQRPAITGVARIALKTNDLAAARRFYGHDLGFAEVPGPGAVFKVNDHQYIELYPQLKSEDEDRLINVAYETTDAKQLRDYLAAHSIEVPAAVAKQWDGNLAFSVKDPEGREIAFVQYLSDSQTGRQSGKSLPATAISARIIHTGFIVQDRAAEDRFYRDILGFEEMWHGGKTEDSVDWLDMRVPDGNDWLEYMLNVRNPTPKTRGVMNHLALGVPNMEAANQRLIDRAATLTEKPKIGRDGKWQLNLYDPNLTRVELMEPKPVQTPCCSPMKPPR